MLPVVPVVVVSVVPVVVDACVLQKQDVPVDSVIVVTIVLARQFVVEVKLVVPEVVPVEVVPVVPVVVVTVVPVVPEVVVPVVPVVVVPVVPLVVVAVVPGGCTSCS